MDHCPISLAFKLHTEVKVKPFKSSFQRSFNDKLKEKLKHAIVQELSQEASPINKLDTIVQTILRFQNQHLKTEIRPRFQAWGKDHYLLRKRQSVTSKIFQILRKQKSIDNTKLAHILPAHPEKEDRSDNAKMTRLLFKLAQLDGAISLDAFKKMSAQQLQIEMQATLKKLKGQIQLLIRQKRTEQIQKAIQQNNLSFKHKRKHFWRSIRKSIKKTSPFLEAVTIEENGQTKVTQNEEIIKAQVLQTYRVITASKGREGENELQRWLRDLETPKTCNQELEDITRSEFAQDEVAAAMKSYPIARVLALTE